MTENNIIKEALPEFENVKRFWDPRHKIQAAKILPGECYVTRQDEMLATILGSCIAACIFDAKNNIGGMNHFMLPINSNDESWKNSVVNGALRYGNWSMEYLLNAVLKHGGEKKYLQAKIFGGGEVIQSITRIGERNIEFVKEYLLTERIEVIGSDMGGEFSRKLLFFPRTGKALVRKLKSMKNATVLEREQRYLNEINQASVQDGDVELFD